MNPAERAGHAIAHQMGGGVHHSSGDWRVRCPVHGGKDRNLSIKNGTKGADIVVRCFSHGCDPVAILSAIEAAGGRERCDAAWPRPPSRLWTDDSERLARSRWLWGKREPLAGTLGDRYLRDTRGCRGPFHSTLGFLPSTECHPPALIAAYGMPDEPEPGVLVLPVEAVRGVQLIRLTADARKLDRPITIGRCLGSPIVLAPLNDGLGLAIAEGIEDALSIHEATGLGAWAAGGASRLPALAGAVPPFADWISLLEDDDPAGRKGVADLEAALLARKLWRREQIERVPLT